MKMDVKPLGNALQDGSFALIVIACVNDANSFRIARLSCFDCSPEDSFPSTPGIAKRMEETDYAVPLCFETTFSPILGRADSIAFYFFPFFILICGRDLLF